MTPARWDAAIFLLAFGTGSFFLGYTLGKGAPMPPVAKVCPAVEGHAVISSSSTYDGEYCTYAIVKGKALHIRRV